MGPDAKIEEPADGNQQAPTVHLSWSRRFLTRLFQADGADAVLKRPWGIITIVLTALGVAADLTSLQGAIPQTAFVLTLISTVTLSFIVFLRLKGFKVFTVPLVVSFVACLAFGAVSTAQAMTGTEEKGLILGTLQRIDRTTQETNVAVDRTEERVDQILENTRIVPECEDSDVYLRVMHAIRQLGEPYSNWTLRGSSGFGTIRRGECWMVVLFLDGEHVDMVEVDITYSTVEGVEITGIQSIMMPEEEKRELIIRKGEPTTVYGVIGPEERRWFSLKVKPGQVVNISAPQLCTR